MGALRFPEHGVGTLAREWPDFSDFIPPFQKWLIYTIDSAPREAEELYRAARKLDIEARGSRMSEPEWDEISYLKPAEQDFAAPDLQHILNHHLHIVDQMRTRAAQTQQPGGFDWEMYPDGFIAITRADWREHGVTAVHCDKDRAKWKVTQCRLPIVELSRLYSIMEVEEDFDQLRTWFDGSDNDGPDNQGGPIPVGEWQYAVYCTASSNMATTILRQKAERTIHDPRGAGNWFRPGEECFDFLRKILPAESVREDWPVEYSRFMKDPTVNGTRKPDVVHRHPSLFVHICGEISNIEIIKMEWDHTITGSDEELKNIGRESAITTWNCEAENLVETLERLAQGG